MYLDLPYYFQRLIYDEAKRYTPPHLTHRQASDQTFLPSFCYPRLANEQKSMVNS